MGTKKADGEECSWGQKPSSEGQSSWAETWMMRDKQKILAKGVPDQMHSKY